MSTSNSFTIHLAVICALFYIVSKCNLVILSFSTRKNISLSLSTVICILVIVIFASFLVLFNLLFFNTKTQIL